MYLYSVGFSGGTIRSESSITISSDGFSSSVKSCCRPTLVTSILLTQTPIHGNCWLKSSIRSYISAVVSLSSDMYPEPCRCRKRCFLETNYKKNDENQRMPADSWLPDSVLVTGAYLNQNSVP